MKRRELHRVRAVRQPHRTGSNPPQRAAVLLRRRGTPIRFTLTVRVQEVERHTVFAGTADRGRNLAQDKPPASNSRSLLKITTLRLSPRGTTPRARPLKQGGASAPRTRKDAGDDGDFRVGFHHAPVTGSGSHTIRGHLQSHERAAAHIHVSGPIPSCVVHRVDGADARDGGFRPPLGRA